MTWTFSNTWRPTSVRLDVIGAYPTARRHTESVRLFAASSQRTGQSPGFVGGPSGPKPLDKQAAGTYNSSVLREAAGKSRTAGLGRRNGVRLGGRASCTAGIRVCGPPAAYGVFLRESILMADRFTARSGST